MKNVYSLHNVLIGCTKYKQFRNKIYWNINEHFNNKLHKNVDS